MKTAYFRSRVDRGVALPIALFFLIVISLLATVGMRRATIGEALSRNQIDFETARQAAEAALRDAERDLASTATVLPRPGALCTRGADERPIDPGILNTAFNAQCNRGQCRMGGANPTAYYGASVYSTTPTNPQPWWPRTHGGIWDDTTTPKPQVVGNSCAFNGGIPIGVFTGTARLAGVRRQPEYMVEFFNRTSDDPMFRITARGYGLGPNTEVVIQGFFKPASLAIL